MDFQQLQFPDIDNVHPLEDSPDLELPVATERDYEDERNFDDDNESVSSQSSAAHSVRNWSVYIGIWIWYMSLYNHVHTECQ